MMLSLNCFVLGQTSNDVITKYIGENSEINGVQVKFNRLTVTGFKKLLLLEEELKGLTTMDIWKVELDIKSINDYTEDEIKSRSTKMEPGFELKEYFNNNDKIPKSKYVHIFIVPTSTGKCLPTRGAIRIWSIRISDEPSVKKADYGLIGLSVR